MPIALQPSTSFTTTLVENSTANRTLVLPNNSGSITAIQNSTPSTTTLTSAHTANRTIALPDRNCTLTDGLQRESSAISAAGKTTINFTIPSYVRRIILAYLELSPSTAVLPLIRLGTSSGAVTTGYTSVAGSINSSSQTIDSRTDAFHIFNSNPSAIYELTGTCELFNISSNIWLAINNSVFSNLTPALVAFGRGSVTLSSALTTVSFLLSGAGTFDAGTVNIFYE